MRSNGSSSWSPRIRAAFERQANACRALGSPLTATLCATFAQHGLGDGALSQRIAAWEGDPAATGDALPLRLTGGLHRLVLEGRAAPLAPYYAPGAAIDRQALHRAALEVAAAEESFLLAYLEQPPQTNEVRRSAIVMAGLLALAARIELPFELLELGASAGLNLIPDAYAYRLGGVAAGDPDSPLLLEPDWSGPPPPEARVAIAGRGGCDLSPLDPANRDDRLRLQSYLWADQSDRIRRFEQAVEIARVTGVAVDRQDALSWLTERLAEPRPGVCRVVFHTIAAQYFPAEVRDRIDALLAEAGRQAGADTPLARLSFENDNGTDGAPLILTLWPDGQTVPLARADFHGRWIHWAGI